MTAKVNLGLEGLPTFKDVDYEEQIQGHIFISPSLDYLERAWDDGKYGRISEHPFLDVVIPSLLDGSLAPDGKHVMSITMLYAPYHLRDSSWEAERDSLGDNIIKTLAQYAPDLPDLIRHCQVITPLDWEQEYSLTEGSVLSRADGVGSVFVYAAVSGLCTVPNFHQEPVPMWRWHSPRRGSDWRPRL